MAHSCKKNKTEGDFKSLASLPVEMGKSGEREKHELPIAACWAVNTFLGFLQHTNAMET